MTQNFWGGLSSSKYTILNHFWIGQLKPPRLTQCVPNNRDIHQVSIDEAEQDMWLCHLSDNQAVKTLGANIYETFCQQSSKTSSSNNDIDNQNETWSSWMFSTAEQLLGIQKQIQCQAQRMIGCILSCNALERTLPDSTYT